MDDCTQTQMQQPSAAAEVAQAFGDVESVPSRNSLVPPSNVAHDNEPSSDAERATDATNEPRPGGSPNAPSNSTTDSLARRDRSDGNGSNFERDEGCTLRATLGCTDHRDDEPIPFAASTFILDGDDGSDYADDSDSESTSVIDSEDIKYVEDNRRRYLDGPHGKCYWLVECMSTE